MSYETYKRKIKEDLTKIEEGYKAGVVPIDQYMAQIEFAVEKLSVMDDPNINKTLDLFDLTRGNISKSIVEQQQKLIKEYEEMMQQMLRDL